MTFHAGALTLMYENGFLRYIKHGEAEILRMIYFALRDENWGTYKPIIENEKISSTPESFTIDYDCYHIRDNVKIFQWSVSITGTSASEIIFRIKGEALTDVWKNRAGFCVLHPLRETTGHTATITHPDKRTSESKFPYFIAAENPFKEVRSMKWKVGEYQYRLDLQGDIFETEDQRNWTDASFKTFCTPLSLPFPALMKKGNKVDQQVSLKALSQLQPVTIEHDFVKIEFDGDVKPMPAVGIGASTEFSAMNSSVAKSLSQLSLSHYRYDVILSMQDWLLSLKDQMQIALSLGLPLELALHFSSDDTIEDLRLFVKEITPLNNIKQILLLSGDADVTTEHFIQEAVPLLRDIGCTNIGAGTNYNFTELNKNHLDASWLDFISYGIHPQEHAFDDRSILETFEAQTFTVLSAKHQYPLRRIHVSAVTLKKRFNPYAKDLAKKILSDAEKRDPRLSTELGALYAFGSIKHLTEAGTASITVFQTHGQQGILSTEGKPFPVFDCLQKILSGKTFVTTKSSDPLCCESFYLSDTDTWIVANYTTTSQKIKLPDQQLITVEGYTVMSIFH